MVVDKMTTVPKTKVGARVVRLDGGDSLRRNTTIRGSPVLKVIRALGFRLQCEPASAD
jgi:hypothetical protein